MRYASRQEQPGARGRADAAHSLLFPSPRARGADFSAPPFGLPSFCFGEDYFFTVTLIFWYRPLGAIAMITHLPLAFALILPFSETVAIPLLVL